MKIARLIKHRKYIFYIVIFWFFSISNLYAQETLSWDGYKYALKLSGSLDIRSNTESVAHYSGYYYLRCTQGSRSIRGGVDAMNLNSGHDQFTTSSKYTIPMEKYSDAISAYVYSSTYVSSVQFNQALDKGVVTNSSTSKVTYTTGKLSATGHINNGGSGVGDVYIGQNIYFNMLPLMDLSTNSTEKYYTAANNTIEFSINPKDSNCPDISYSRASMTWSLEVKSVDSDDSAWASVVDDINSSTVSVDYDAIEDLGLIGKELTFRLRLNGSGSSYYRTDLSSSVTIPEYTSESLVGIFFIECPDLSIDPVVNCPGEEPYIRLSNFPTDNGTGLIISVARYSTDDSQGSGVPDIEEGGIDYYWDSQFTYGDDIAAGVETYDITNAKLGNNFSLDDGYYTIQINFNNGKMSDMCPQSGSCIVKSPEAISIDLSSYEYSYTEGEVTNTYNTTTPTSTASIKAVISGGTSPYEYVYLYRSSDNSLVQTKTGISGSCTFTGITMSSTSESFYIVVSDGSCTGVTSDEITLTRPEPISITVGGNDVTNVTCNGGEDGQIAFTLSGGIGPYSATFSGTTYSNLGTTGKTFSGLSAGTYSIIVSDGYGNTATKSNISITQPNAVSVSAVVDKYVSCNGYNNGSVSLTVNNAVGTKTYEYLKDNATDYTSITVNGLSSLYAGAYIFRVTDANGCTATSSTVTVSEPSAVLAIEDITYTNTTCELKDGTLSFKVKGGWSDAYPYTAQVTVDNNTSTKEITSGISGEVEFTGLASGTYSIYVLNNDGCSNSASETIGSIDNMNMTTSIENYVSCSGKSNGVIKYTVSDGDGTYTINDGTYDSYASDVFIKNNCQADTYYYLSIKDGRGCTAYANPEMKVNPNATSFATGSPSTSPATCTTASDGSISFTIQGDIENYTYTLNGAEENTVSNNGTYGYTGKEPGNYTLVVSDGDGCSISSVVNIAANTNPVSISSISDVILTSCAGISDGEFTVNASSSSDIVSYNISYDEYNNQNTTGGFSGLVNHTYDIEVVDEKGCSVEDTYILATKGHSPNPTVEVIEELGCTTASNGEIKINVEAYTDDSDKTFDISFYDDENNLIASSSNDYLLSVSGLENKTYRYTAIDSDGCLSSAISYTPEVMSTPVSLNTITEADITKASCIRAQNGEVKVSASGGYSTNGEYTFLLGEESLTGNTVTFSGLLVGQEGTIEVTDDVGCTSSVELPNITVQQDTIQISGLTATDSKCPNDATGQALPTLDNANDTDGYLDLLVHKLNSDNEYAYYSQNAEYVNGDAIEGLSAGYYTAYITDDDNCSASYAFSIGEPSIPSFSFNNNLIVDKYDSTGELTVDITGGNGSFNWSLTGAQGNTGVFSSGENKITGLPAGDYTIQLQDIYECNYNEYFVDSWYSKTFTIAEPEFPLTLTYKVDSVNCYGEENGAIQLEVSGGWGDYTYNFTIDGESKTDADGKKMNLPAGTYPVEITDKEGAVRTATIVVYEPDLFYFNNLVAEDIINASCPGYGNGSVPIVLNNGILLPDDNLYYYAKKSGSQDVLLKQYGSRAYTFEGMSQGTYRLYATDRNGCMASSDLLTVTEPVAPVIDLDYNYIKAKGASTGYINAEILNGNQNFDYQWINNSSDEVFNEGRTNTLTDVNNLFAGDYLLRVKDTAECNYEGTDAWMERTISIVEPEDTLSFGVVNNTAVSCNGLSDGTFTVSGTGGWGTDYVYGFSTDEMSTTPTFDELSADEYLIYVKDTSGVVYARSITITEPEVLTAQIDSFDYVNCYGENNGAIYLSAQGGNLSYLVSTDDTNWETGTTIDSLYKGSYNIYLKDTLDCKVSLEALDITQPDDIVLANSAVRISKCGMNSGRIDAFIEGGVPEYSYLWENENINSEDFTTSVVDSIYSGAYALTITDQHNCQKEFNFYVSDLTNLAIDTIYVEDVSCWEYSDGTAEIVPTLGTAPYEYSWDKLLPQEDASYMSGIATGTYYAGLFDSEGCKVYKQFYVGTPDSIAYTINTMVDPLCLGGVQGTITLNATGGTPEYAYVWDHGITSNTLTDVTPGTYSLKVTDSHSCVNSFDFTFDYQRTIKPVLGNDTVICHYQTLNIDPGTFASYRWTGLNGFSSSRQSPDINAPSEYYLTVTDDDDCLGYDTLNVEVSYIDITNVDIKDVTCYNDQDGEVEIEYTEGYGNTVITWPDGIGTSVWSVISGGDYSVVASDDNGCVSEENFTVNEPDILGLETQKLIDPSCFGVPDGQIKVKATGGNGDYQYLWNTGETSQNYTRLDTGYYHLTYWDKLNCLDTVSYSLTYQTTIYPDLGNDVTICNGNTYDLYPGDYTSYFWSSDVLEETSADSSYVASTPGTYYVEVMDDEECIGRDTVSVLWSETDLNPVFLMASTVAVGDTVYMAEVSQPEPDDFEWYLDAPYTIVEQGTYYMNVVFEETGVFDAGIDTYLDGCLAQWRQKIVVTEASDEEGESGSSTTEKLKVTEFTVGPNPADVEFVASVELTEVLPLTYYIVNISTGAILETREVSGLYSYSESFTVPSSKTVLLVFIVVNGERYSKKVIAGE